MEDIEEVEEKKLRQKYIKAAKTAPAKVFADGKNGMTVDDIRKEVVEYCETCDIEDLENFELEITDCPFSRMSKMDAMNTILRAAAINFNYIKESAVIGKFYDFLSKVQDTKDVDINVYYSSIVDWHITLYENNYAFAAVQHADQTTAFLMAHEALKTWMKAV